jgi:c-di-GMP-binding flagellar brake protein YcgR
METNAPQVMLHGGNPLRVWEPIEIMVGEGGDRGRYQARIEDFINGGIVVSEPVFIDGSTLLRDNIDVIITLTREDAVYQFSSHIRRSNISGGRQVILSPPRYIKRTQRRLFHRVEAMEDLSFALIKPSMDYDDYDQRLIWWDTTTKDISGGGLLIYLTSPIEVDDLMLVRLRLPESVEFPDVVVAVCRRVYNRDNSWWAGIEFVTAGRLGEFFDLDEAKRLPPAARQFDFAAQDRLVNYTFSKQIDMRKRGLL